MSTIAVIAKLPVQPGKRNEAIAALETLVDLARSEDGTTTYVVHEDQGDADLIWVYEQYRDAAALDAHMNADAMKQFLGAAGSLMAGRPELIMLTPVHAKET